MWKLKHLALGLCVVVGGLSRISTVWAGPVDIDPNLIRVNLPKFGQSQELILSIDYDVRCIPRAQPYMTAHIAMPDRTLRTHLFSRKKQSLVNLGRPKVPFVELRIEEDDDCFVYDIKAAVAVKDLREPDLDPSELMQARLQRLISLHSPQVNVRGNQYQNTKTDILMGMAASVEKIEGTRFTLNYTAYFSDEDSISSTKCLNGQMACYGRTADIEFVYKVRLDLITGEVFKREYHGAVYSNMGHEPREFKGAYAEGTQHPILYVISQNNVFSDQPYSAEQKQGRMAYAPVVTEEIKAPHAREEMLFNNTWMFEVSDAEQRAEKKSTLSPLSYLYVRIDAAPLTGIPLMKRVQGRWTSGSQEIRSGGGDGAQHVFGEDMHDRQSYTALPLGPQLMDKIVQGYARGTFDILLQGHSTKLDLRSVRFYRLVSSDKGMVREDITEHFVFDHHDKVWRVVGDKYELEDNAKY